ncbi:hypothetical protein [Micromonospora sp. HNM0581]|uniref:hypothetical protein n=1 Tax=Micromonospora sp. HNM0581 TaxID=2716341 RepID=UPI001F0FEC5A|nr:hypothetical protein [Micromonospora sp. HNM0581]
MLFVVLSSGRYAIMDRLAGRAGGNAPLAVLNEVVPTLADRSEPLLLDVSVGDADVAP